MNLYDCQQMNIKMNTSKAIYTDNDKYNKNHNFQFRIEMKKKSFCDWND